ncbi:hypothetical protein [Desulforhopalus sp. IMCC35007]|uniref:hypothetical protein n=1 Tax=Desulforhopalus sp. IMCC35007 TaxID=2569543 RepID=UPI0010ADFC30|nr:hypothetical protein [Desulforhopalus sp. IMCC35007]TKB12072.1 hypothetical protein FCL48_00010 [Desulforhopalus sp. IMCC35007]
MVSPNCTAIIFILLTAFCWNNSAYSRQNIVIGEISTGYDFAERKYDDNDNEVTTEVTVPAGQNTDSNLAEAENVVTDDLGPNETDEGDVRRWIITPRIRISSQGINDLLEFTYAPTLYYEELESDTDMGHDLNLLAEKSFTRNWSFYASDNYYYGDDAVEDALLSSSAIIPGTDETEDEQTIGAEQAEGTDQSLREQNERHEYWRNTLDIGTDYTYAQDSVVGLGYTFGVLRNISDDEDGYQDYDRHEGTGRLSYRFNRSWQMETQVGYVKGIYEPTEITFIQPEIIQVPVEDESDEEEGMETEYEEQTVYNQSEEEFSDDLEEYQFLLQLNYDWRTHDRLFSLYSYDATDYESVLREDAAIHEITLGWSHDFSRALHMTLSGGPSFATYDERSTDTGYNAYAGLIWDFQHASLTANSSYGYEFDNFDGDRTGLSQTWRSELGYSYQFSPQLSLSLSTGYERSDNEEPLATTVLLNLEGEDTTDDNVTEYTEESYDVGLTLSYNFLRWYTVSASYRYADYQSEIDRDYDEHRVYLTLSASKEIFRW